MNNVQFTKKYENYNWSRFVLARFRQYDFDTQFFHNSIIVETIHQFHFDRKIRAGMTEKGRTEYNQNLSFPYKNRTLERCNPKCNLYATRHTMGNAGGAQPQHDRHGDKHLRWRCCRSHLDNKCHWMQPAKLSKIKPIFRFGILLIRVSLTKNKTNCFLISN